MVLTECEPKKVFEYFELISSVPHGSGNTKEISDFVVEFAKKRKLEYYKDELNNVIIYKEASKGYENKETVILQGHMDMVCAKRENCKKDMSKEPIELETDGKFVWAKDTSLGGDDGIAVAMAMAILDDEKIKHPKLEVVLTVDEETGLIGAAGLNFNKLHGKILINMDEEDADTFTAGCAGGVRCDTKIPVLREKINENHKQIKLTISGLKAGHSGTEIDKERANGNILMLRLLYEAYKKSNIKLCKIDGGEFDNAICGYSEAIIAVETEKYSLFEKEATEYFEKIKNEYKTSDPDIVLAIEKLEECEKREECEEYSPIIDEDTEKILMYGNILPNGVQNMSADIKGLVETSLNLGIVMTTEDCIKFTSLIRSSVKSRKEQIVTKLATIAKIFGGEMTTRGEYPGWEFKPKSQFRENLAKEYEKVFGKMPNIVTIHAGLECGVFSEAINDLDCVSIGPNIYDIHSPNERLDVESVKKIYEVVVNFLGKN